MTSGRTPARAATLCTRRERSDAHVARYTAALSPPPPHASTRLTVFSRTSDSSSVRELQETHEAAARPMPNLEKVVLSSGGAVLVGGVRRLREGARGENCRAAWEGAGNGSASGLLQPSPQAAQRCRGPPHRRCQSRSRRQKKKLGGLRARGLLPKPLSPCNACKRRTFSTRYGVRWSFRRSARTRRGARTRGRVGRAESHVCGASRCVRCSRALRALLLQPKEQGLPTRGVRVRGREGAPRGRCRELEPFRLVPELTAHCGSGPVCRPCWGHGGRDIRSALRVICEDG